MVTRSPQPAPTTLTPQSDGILSNVVLLLPNPVSPNRMAPTTALSGSARHPRPPPVHAIHDVRPGIGVWDGNASISPGAEPDGWWLILLRLERTRFRNHSGASRWTHSFLSPCAYSQHLLFSCCIKLDWRSYCIKTHDLIGLIVLIDLLVSYCVLCTLVAHCSLMILL